MKHNTLVSVPAWVVLQSVRYALPRHTYAVQETADNLVTIWLDLPPETREVIRRDIEEHLAYRYALPLEVRRGPGGYHDDDTWQACLGRLSRLDQGERVAELRGDDDA